MYDLGLFQPFRLQAIDDSGVRLVGWLSPTTMDGGQTQMWQLRWLGFTCRSKD